MATISISREESTAIKGLMMMLIILGHNTALSRWSADAWQYLYTFHVAIFFILPFFYPVKSFSKSRVLTYFVRLYIPYIILFILFSVTIWAWYSSGGMHLPSAVSGNGDNSLLGFFLAMLTGGWEPIARYTSLQYLWFLPAMFACCVLKDAYYSLKSVWIRALLLILGAVCFVVMWCYMYGNPFGYIFMHCSPFSVLQGLAFLFMGVVAVFLIANVKINKYVVLTAFVAISVLFFVLCADSQSLAISHIYKVFMPFLVMEVLITFKSNLNTTFFREFGERSLLIYLVQSPVCAVFTVVIPMIYKSNDVFIVILTQCFIMAISYYLALFISKINFLRRLIAPRSFSDLMGKQ